MDRLDKSAVSFAWPAPGGRATARLFFLTGFCLTAAAWRVLSLKGIGSGQAVGPYSLKFFALLTITAVLGAALLVCLLLLFRRTAVRFTHLYQSTLGGLVKLRGWNGLGVLGVWAGYVLIFIWFFDKQFGFYLARLWLFYLASGIGALFLLGARPRMSFFWAFLVTAVLYGFGLKALSYLPQISSDPFTLGWSEASRFYYASLPYSRWLYGLPIPLSPWHPSRYLLMSLPFLIPESPIVIHRLWQVLLWLSLSTGTGYALARRVGIRSTGAALAFAAWAGLFLLQGPVYYHLLVCVLLVLVGVRYRPEKGKFGGWSFWTSLGVVAAASAWAGISRVNWIPVPAFVAVTIYLLERPVCGLEKKDLRGWWSYLWPPAAWGIVGGAAALLAQFAYMLVSGHEDTSPFNSTYQSDLLWYRLLPSPTSGLGVLPIILIVTLPLLAAVVGAWLRDRRSWHWLRLVGISGMVLTLFGGGLVVSTKIGGGSNIHNLDAYMVLLLVLGAFILFRVAQSERGGSSPTWMPWLLALSIVCVPVLWNLNIGHPFARHNAQQAAVDLARLQAAVEKYSGVGEVLFITQRQMQVFHLIQGAPMIPEYELLTLSEMSLSNNQAYLKRFTDDLRNHRFALIIADPQRELIQDPRKAGFAEENNAWVINISRPILEYYQGEQSIKSREIQMYVPKP